MMIVKKLLHELYLLCTACNLRFAERVNRPKQTFRGCTSSGSCWRRWRPKQQPRMTTAWDAEAHCCMHCRFQMSRNLHTLRDTIRLQGGSKTASHPLYSNQ